MRACVYVRECVCMYVRACGCMFVCVYVYVCVCLRSDPESIRAEWHVDGPDLQDERPGGEETDGGVELLLPHGAAEGGGGERKWRRRPGEGQGARRAGL